MEYILRWTYPCENERQDEREFRVFTQTIDTDRYKKRGWFPQFCGGSHIINLINACYADKEIRFDFENCDQIFRDTFEHNITELYAQTSLGYLCAHCDMIAYIAETIFAIVKRECIIQNPDQARDYQQTIDRYLAEYNGLVEHFLNCLDNNAFNADFYNQLRATLEEYNDNDHSAIQRYLQKKEKGGRCFATFIEAVDQSKYVAFSGFLDCEDPNILNWLSCERQPFVDIAKAICNINHAKLVQTNVLIKVYSGYCFNSISIRDCLGAAMTRTRKGSEEEKKQFACAERKIFSEWDDLTPSGSLYVKYPMCCLCCKGYKYQIQRGGVTINVYDGLL